MTSTKMLCPDGEASKEQGFCRTEGKHCRKEAFRNGIGGGRGIDLPHFLTLRYTRLRRK